MNFVLASTSSLAIPSLERLESEGHGFNGALTFPDSPAGRGRKLKKNDFAQYCEGRGLAVHYVENSTEISHALEITQPEIAIAISFGKLIKSDALKIPKYGWINLHFSLLPLYRGAAPVQRAILDGRIQTGVTVFQLDQGMDTGPIYQQLTYEIPPDSSSADVLLALSKLGADCLVRTMDAVDQGLMPKAQMDTEASFAPKIDKSETRILWTDDAESNSRKIRAFFPEPGAWAIFRKQRMTFTKAKANPSISAAPGIIANTSPLQVGTSHGVVEIARLIPEGKREMTAADWVRGARITAEDHFE